MTIQRPFIKAKLLKVYSCNHRRTQALWEKTIQESLIADFGMNNEEASGVIQEMSGMEIKEACHYLEEQYGYHSADFTWEDTAYRKGTMDESMLISRKNWKNIHFPGTFQENLQILQGCLWVYSNDSACRSLYAGHEKKYL